jgi:hypothetical protein
MANVSPSPMNSCTFVHDCFLHATVPQMHELGACEAWLRDVHAFCVKITPSPDREPQKAPIFHLKYCHGMVIATHLYSPMAEPVVSAGFQL